MRAGRLLSILLLLQTRGRMTAAELAAELEVSVRTVYRDTEALHAAGVPLYGDAGHRGGYRLLDGYRTRLTGLDPVQARALFLSGVPGPAAELGLGAALAAAQLRVSAALPPALREQAGRIRRRFHLDAPGWYAQVDPVPYLPEVARALWDGRALRLRYRRWKEPTEVERRLEPYGLVLKAGRWYLVAAPGPRVYRVDQILELDLLEDEAVVPEDFDLAAYWQAHQERFHGWLHTADAVVRVSPEGAARLTGPAALALRATGEPQPDGWTRAVLPVESPEHTCREFLALGAEIEVLEPPELRERMAATARAIAALHAGPAGSPEPAVR
ncbi:helix-turn-helix transcriptional regulator [Kitasatospora sp. NPDC057015]|uniref:helix-turn-helix transcriptional regulator n=1 Tax=Kitasatospora sp. NPDC057015 TaxID=3346001 RepID=UPI003626868E